MSTTIIKAATVQVTVDASIVFSDDSGVPTVKRGSTLMASDAGQSFEYAANSVIAFRKLGVVTGNVRIGVVDGGLATLARLIGSGFLYSAMYFSDSELASFATTRYGSTAPTQTVNWAYQSSILASLAGEAFKHDYIFLADLSMPVTAAQLQPFCKTTGFVYFPGGKVAGTAP